MKKNLEDQWEDHNLRKKNLWKTSLSFGRYQYFERSVGRSKLALLCAIRVQKNVPKKIKLAYKFQNSMMNLYSYK